MIPFLRLSRHKHQQKCLQTSTLDVFFFFATNAQTLVTYRSSKGAFPPETLKTATLNKICGRGADTGKPKKTKKVTTLSHAMNPSTQRIQKNPKKPPKQQNY
jgi:hypothetical protein